MYCTLATMNSNRINQPEISYAPPRAYQADNIAPRAQVENTAFRTEDRKKFNTPAPAGLDWRTIEPQRQPSQFGPHYWYMLHSMALNYPVNPTAFAKTKMKAFIEAIPFLLPCLNCTEHAKEFMANANIQEALNGRKDLFTFFWNFHNLVNTRLGKPEMSFDEALNLYKG